MFLYHHSQHCLLQLMITMIIRFALLRHLFFGAGAALLTLQVIQPPNYVAVCPGEDLIVTCSISSMSVPPALYWQQIGYPVVSYYNGAPLSARVGDFNTTAHFSNNNFIIVSNATLKSTVLSHNGIVIYCLSTQSLSDAVIMIAGAKNSPSAVTINSISNTSASLTWLPPLQLNCTFNYTVNITYSTIMIAHVNVSSTSLTLTGLIHGQNYSFAVAVVDSTGQHGLWSEQLMVTWNGLKYFVGDDLIPTSTTILSSSLPALDFLYHTSIASPPGLITSLHTFTDTLHDSTTYLKITNTLMKDYIAVVTPTSGSKGEEEFTDQAFIYILVIGLTSAALLICCVLLTAAVCVIWCLRKKNKKGKYPADGHHRQDCVRTTSETIVQQNVAYENIHNPKYDSTPQVDMVVYDVPIFTNRHEVTEEMVIQQNVAYEQVQ